MDEVKINVDGQWYYRGNRSPKWFALASRLDGSPCGIADKVPPRYWPTLEKAVVSNAKDAARFRYLQNLPRAQAQAYFWNYESRRQRAEAIDNDMKDAA